MGCKIYYDTEAIYEGDPDNAPPLGVIGIVQEIKGKKVPLHTRDFYWFDIGQGIWQGSDHWGMMDQLLHNRKNVGQVLAGRTIDERTIQVIMQRIVADVKG